MDKMYRKFGEIWTVVLEIRKRRDRQTNKQTDKQTSRCANTLIIILHTPAEGELINNGDNCRKRRFYRQTRCRMTVARQPMIDRPHPM